MNLKDFSSNKSLRVLIISPYFDKNIAGESWCTYKWVKGISERCETTVLTTHKKGWDPSGSPIEAKDVINWEHPVMTGRLARLDWELKPHYLLFYWRVKKWIKSRNNHVFPFDIIHQINPVALRYPSPACKFSIPYITGPHAGSLPTPSGFLANSKKKVWYRDLRNLDSWRLKHDKLLRRSFSEAAAVVGVAPYVKEILSSIPIKRFEVLAETGPEVIIEESKKISDENSPLKLLFVGRLIQTKGVIEAIRAAVIASKESNIVLNIIGTGELLEECKAEVENSNSNSFIKIHGRKSREEVYEWYRQSDVFLFPSYREPSGTVVFEAMGFGLPLITSSLGGPGYVINEKCGIRVKPLEPKQYTQCLAQAIVDLSKDREKVRSMSEGALKRVKEVASWEKRFDKMISIYRDVLS